MVTLGILHQSSLSSTGCKSKDLPDLSCYTEAVFVIITPFMQYTNCNGHIQIPMWAELLWYFILYFFTWHHQQVSFFTYLDPVYTRTVKTTKYFIRSAFCLHGDGVFGAWKCKNLKPPSRVGKSNTLLCSIPMYTGKTQNFAQICSRRICVYITYICQYREINKHVGLFPCIGPSSCSGGSNKGTGVFPWNVQDMYR